MRGSAYQGVLHCEEIPAYFLYMMCSTQISLETIEE